MLQTDEFPKSILTALDALAQLGKAVQEQAPKKQLTCFEIFMKKREQAVEQQDPKRSDK
jgi:hypothetical protein